MSPVIWTKLLPSTAAPPSRPVSYTHLDVYKRQVQQGVNNVCTGNAVVVNGVEHFLIDAGAGSLQDVYKRQICALCRRTASTAFLPASWLLRWAPPLRRYGRTCLLYTSQSGAEKLPDHLRSPAGRDRPALQGGCTRWRCGPGVRRPCRRGSIRPRRRCV